MSVKKIAKSIVIALIGLIILFNLLTAIFSATGLDRKLGIPCVALFTVTTGSMEPAMSVGDLLVEWNAPYEEIEVGDDITFSRNEEFITHRVIRKDGSRLVTQGIANNTEDTSIGPQEYCGKVVLVIPWLGVVYDILTHPLSLVCALIFVLSLFYGNAFVIWAMEKSERKDDPAKEQKIPFNFGGSLKICLTALTVSFLLLSPFMTEAKYVALVNERRAVAADTLYMTSNIASEDGNQYAISGWSGNAKGLTLTVNNYENEKLFNGYGNDLIYSIRLVKIGQDGRETYRTEYSLTCNGVEATEATEEEAELFGFPDDLETGVWHQDLPVFILKGDDAGKKTDTFDLVVVKDTGVTFTAGQKIRFKVFVSTSDIHGYLRTLSGDYTLEVAGSNQFVESTTKDTKPGTLLVTYNIKTGAVDGSGTRNIIVSWDSATMYINEYEQSVFKTLVKYQKDDGTYDEELFYRGNGTDDDGFIYLPLPAYANVTLQFFKRDAYLYSENNTFTIDWAEDSATENN